MVAVRGNQCNCPNRQKAKSCFAYSAANQLNTSRSAPSRRSFRVRHKSNPCLEETSAVAAQSALSLTARGEGRKGTDFHHEGLCYSKAGVNSWFRLQELPARKETGGKSRVGASLPSQLW